MEHESILTTNSDMRLIAERVQVIHYTESAGAGEPCSAAYLLGGAVLTYAGLAVGTLSVTQPAGADGSLAVGVGDRAVLVSVTDGTQETKGSDGDRCGRNPKDAV